MHSSFKCSWLKSSAVNSLSAILCMVEQLFATVPTLYVSNSFHQYSGAVISSVTVIIRMNFPWKTVKANVERSIAIGKEFGCKTFIGLSGDLEGSFEDTQKLVLLENLKRTAEIATMLDTKYIRMFSFFVDEAEADAKTDEGVETLSKMVSYTAQHAIDLLHAH